MKRMPVEHSHLPVRTGRARAGAEEGWLTQTIIGSGLGIIGALVATFAAVPNAVT